ncbi:hypothetical protein C8R42DRAFT_715993 [Lentinula raphanica]|nr:hypothetical protein C8R42DRAFT_715993 [Lentinula raphanica]
MTWMQFSSCSPLRLGNFLRLALVFALLFGPTTHAAPYSREGSLLFAVRFNPQTQQYIEKSSTPSAIEEVRVVIVDHSRHPQPEIGVSVTSRRVYSYSASFQKQISDVGEFPMDGVSFSDFQLQQEYFILLSNTALAGHPKLQKLPNGPAGFIQKVQSKLTSQSNDISFANAVIEVLGSNPSPQWGKLVTKMNEARKASPLNAYVMPLPHWAASSQQ